MKLLIDLSGCDMPYSSITVYSMRILSGFKDNGIKNINILCNSVTYDMVKALVPEYNVIPIEMKRMFSPIPAVKAYFRWRRIVKSIDYDIIYLPHPFPPFHCIYNKGKIVTTMLDIQGIKENKGIKLLIFKMAYSLALKKSHRLTTISAFVKEDILKHYPQIDPKKIQPVLCPVVIAEPQKNTSPIKEKYILYVSSFLRHKNVMTLIKAFNQIRDKVQHQLVLIGRENDLWRKEIMPYIEEHNLMNRIIHIANGVTNEELSQYYKYADLFVHPSYMEGFGYPPIEAAILETPVVTTKVTSLYETTMGLLNYYEDPTDEKELAEKIIYVLTNKPSEERLKEISDSYKKEYNYRTIAKKLYCEILKA